MASARSDTSSAIEIAQLKISVGHLATLVEKQLEAMEGTAKTPGLKEKIAIAQYNIEANKQAYQAVLEEMTRMEQRIGKSQLELSNKIERQINDGLSALRTEVGRLQKADEVSATTLQKLQPWINVLAWIITTAGVVLIGMLLNGRISVTP